MRDSKPLLDGPEIRSSLVERINGTLANLDMAKKRVAETRTRCEKVINDAKAQIGTAEHEVRKLENEYIELRGRLFKQLPNLEPPPGPPDPPRPAGFKQVA